MTAPAGSVYTVKVRCGNCGYEGDGVFKKGVSVRESKCPECECKEVLCMDRSASSIG